MTADPRRALPRIDGFTVERLIGDGGFSRVYEALQLDVHRRVAVKILNTGFEDEREERKFTNECRVMGALSHEHIVTVHRTAMTDDARPCIVMALFAGTCGAADRLEPDEVVAVGAAIADALAYAHGEHVFHHDIKPDNIFVSASGKPALGDFGISSNARARSVSGAQGFTLEYAPPELFTDDDAPTASRDIYSLGATLYRLASGSIPFPGMSGDADVKRSVVRLLTEPTPRLPAWAASPALADVVEWCMAKNPADRPTDAGIVRDRLREIQRRDHLDGVADLRRLVAHVAPAHDAVDPPAPPLARPAEPPTVIRDRDARPPAKPVPDTGDEDVRGRRRTAVGAALVAGLVVLAGLLIAVWPDGGEGTASTTLPSLAPATTLDFVVLVPPDGLTVGAAGDRTFELAWSSSQDGVKFQVLLVGTGENRIADGSPYVWTFDADTTVPDAVCFEVRTVSADETRMSQAKSAPACAG